MKKISLLSFCGLLLCAELAWACFHISMTYGGNVSYSQQEFFVYREGSNAHLITRPSVDFKNGVPESMGWIVPVPAVPTEYKEEDEKLFSELWNYFKRSTDRAAIPQSGPLPASAIQLHEKRFVGRYEIQPIEILDQNGGKELNDWLETNGFKKVDLNLTEYYLKNKYCFLAVKITGLNKPQERLKPLHIVYASPRLAVPLKFAYDSSPFDVDIYFFSTSKVDITDDSLSSYLLKVRGVTELLMTAVDPLTQQTKNYSSIYPSIAALNLPGGYLYKISGKKINSFDKPVFNWKEDPSLP